MREVGQRVGAILGAKEGIVEFLGYGVYEGDHIPEEAVGFMADASRVCKWTNPRIRLDSGKVVYGCECWWGSEAKVKVQLAEYRASGYRIVEVDIDAIRKKYADGEINDKKR